MRHYETLVLFSPELAPENRQTILATFTGVIEREKGEIVKLDDWGMRDLAYPVKKQMRGYFVRLDYNAVNTTVAELERNIRISDGIFKFSTVKLGDEPFVAAAAPQEA
jgi:small subunit ribosomal protein S6